MVQKILILAFFATCHGQLADVLFPRVANTVRQTAGSLTSNPVASRATNLAGGLLTDTFNIFTNVPITIARSLTGGDGFNGVPGLINDNNLAALSDNFLSEFNFGLRNEDCNLNCDQLIAKYGHSVETHEVLTEDGYILKMFRIPRDGPVVYLQHGLLGSADDYIVAGPDSGLAYLLAKEGYDVWLGNSRGCKHSRRHIEMSPSQGAFWDFSWHEVGYYDLPAMINYALNTTGQEKLKYVGHSQGTTAFWVMGSERPEYMEKIALMVALSPVAFMSHMKSPIIRFLAPTGGIIHAFAKTIGLYELAPDNNLMRVFRRIACGAGPLAEIMCTNLLFLVAGYNVEQLNVTNLPVIFSHAPSGASAKQFAHYGQGVISGQFRKFDYGSGENQARYGVSTPPDYDLSRVTAPVSLVYSDADWLCDARDVDKLYNRLPNAIDIHKVPSRNFNHLDFVFAKDVKSLIFERLSKLLAHF
ncbi:lipase 3-like [Leguminivora glycinivorella]|uniref:lipase 3-like n=1 Tax=Leguminivora glycinivorella TaxID=1035111 RepID=UPI00200DE1F3|nr:lipase 3-like [Leguminivora glycinivorella]